MYKGYPKKFIYANPSRVELLLTEPKSVVLPLH